MLAVLLRQRGLLLWNRMTRGPDRVRRVLTGAIAVGSTFGFIALAGLNAGFLVERIERTDPAAAVRVIPIALAGVTLLTLVTSLSSAFHHLYAASDLELLLAAPVPAWSFFGLKIFEIARDSLHVILFEAGALYGFGQSLHLPITYYPTAVVVGGLLTLSSSAVGATLTLLIAQVRFGQSVLGAGRLLTLLLLMPIGVLGVPAFGLGRGGASLFFGRGTTTGIASGIGQLGTPPSWAPTTWAAHVLLGDQDANLSLLLLTATTAVAFIAVQTAFSLQYQRGWERVRFAGPAPRGRRFTFRAPELRLHGAVPSLVAKDWRTVLRDPRWRGGTLFSLLALVVPAVALLMGDPFGRGAHSVRFWLSLLPVPYLAYLFGSQQGASMLIYEGRNLALLRAGPIDMPRVLFAKFLGGLTIVLAATWAATLIIGLTHGGAALEMLAALAVAAWLAIGSTLSAIAVAALTADFDADNPQRRIGWIGTVLTSGLALVFFASTLVLLIWWLARLVFGIPRPLSGLMPLLDWGLPALVVVSAGLIGLAATLGARRLTRWDHA